MFDIVGHGTQRNCIRSIDGLFLGFSVCDSARNLRDFGDPASIVLLPGLDDEAQVFTPSAVRQDAFTAHIHIRMPDRTLRLNLTEVMLNAK